MGVPIDLVFDEPMLHLRFHTNGQHAAQNLITRLYGLIANRRRSAIESAVASAENDVADLPRSFVTALACVTSQFELEEPFTEPLWEIKLVGRHWIPCQIPFEKIDGNQLIDQQAPLFHSRAHQHKVLVIGPHPVTGHVLLSRCSDSEVGSIGALEEDYGVEFGKPHAAQLLEASLAASDASLLASVTQAKS